MATRSPWLVLLLVVAVLVAGSACSACRAQEAVPSRPDRGAVQKLVQALGSDRFEDREEAGRRLVGLGEAALEELKKATTSSDQEVSRRATACIEQIILNGKIARLVAQMQSRVPRERAKAVLDLKPFGQSAAAAVPALIRALDDSDALVRDYAVWTLSWLGPAAKPAVPKLITMLEDEKLPQSVRDQVLIAFCQLGATARAATPTLLKLAKGSNVDQAIMAVSTLAHVAKDQDAPVPVLLELLKHPNASMRSRAAATLGMLGKQPEVVAPAILELLKRDKAKPAKGKDDTRGLILGGLWYFGPRAKPALPIILEILSKEEDDFMIVTRCLDLLESIGPDAKEALPALLKLSEQSEGALVEDQLARTLAAIRGK